MSNKLVIDIDDSDLFHDLTVWCAENSMTKKRVITELVKLFLTGTIKLQRAQ